MYFHVIYFLFLNIAGHYVPAFGAEIVKSNSPYAKNLKGVGKYELHYIFSFSAVHNNVNVSGIGNGWVDPKIQYGAYAEVCCIIYYDIRRKVLLYMKGNMCVAERLIELIV